MLEFDKRGSELFVTNELHIETASGKSILAKDHCKPKKIHQNVNVPYDTFEMGKGGNKLSPRYPSHFAQRVAIYYQYLIDHNTLHDTLGQ